MAFSCSKARVISTASMQRKGTSYTVSFSNPHHSQHTKSNKFLYKWTNNGTCCCRKSLFNATHCANDNTWCKYTHTELPQHSEKFPFIPRQLLSSLKLPVITFPGKTKQDFRPNRWSTATALVSTSLLHFRPSHSEVLLTFSVAKRLLNKLNKSSPKTFIYCWVMNNWLHYSSEPIAGQWKTDKHGSTVKK